MLTWLNKYRDVGLLIVRVGLGVMYMIHGVPKMMGGPGKWAGLAAGVGLTVGGPFWGFMAAFSESVGGLLLAMGLLFRPAVGLIFCTMMGALSFHLRRGDGFEVYSRPIEMMIMFAGLFLIGAGRYSVDECKCACAGGG